MLMSGTLLLAVVKNKSPFFMNLGMVFFTFILANWAFWLTSKWVFSVTVIFYLGGMMVLFGYIISLSKSKHTTFQYPEWPWLLAAILMYLTYQSISNTTKVSFNPYYLANYQMIFFLASALLILLIVVNKICMSYSGPMAYKSND